MKDVREKFIRQTRRNYDRLSSIYDFLSSSSEARIVRRLLQKIQNRENKNMLDIGCGTGESLLKMLELHPEVNYLCGMDLSFEMCRMAMKKINQFDEQGYVTISCANALKSPFSQYTFDGILLSFTLELFPQPLINELLQECNRILKHSGELLVVSIAVPKYENLIYRFYCWAHEIFPHVVDCRPIRADQMLRDADFKVENNEEFSIWGIPVSVITARK